MFAKHSVLVVVMAAVLICFSNAQAAGIPDGFVYVSEVIPDIVEDLRYYGENNFLGARVDGYEAPRAVLSKPAALALKGVQDDLRPFGLGLKIFDAYRPQRAVNHFVRWAKDLKDTKNKAGFYPDVDKKHLFRDGYIASKSGHTRGSTVDLTIVSLQKPDVGRQLDMGTTFDYFGKASWPFNLTMDAGVRANRLLLQSLMVKHGFDLYDKEWWHFTLKNEPYPDTYFDFPIR